MTVLGSSLFMPWGEENPGGGGLTWERSLVSDLFVLLSGSGLWGVICVALFTKLCLIEELYSGLCFCCSSVLPVSQLPLQCTSTHVCTHIHALVTNADSLLANNSSSLARATQCIYWHTEYLFLVIFCHWELWPVITLQDIHTSKDVTVLHGKQCPSAWLPASLLSGVPAVKWHTRKHAEFSANM